MYTYFLFKICQWNECIYVKMWSYYCSSFITPTHKSEGETYSDPVSNATILVIWMCLLKAFVTLPKLKHILDNRTAPHILKTSYITGHIRSLSQTRSLKGSLCFLVSPGLGHMPVYFSNLPGSVRSRVRMFAYDTDVYLKLKWQTSAQCIKEGLHNLVGFSEHTENRNQLAHTHYNPSPGTTEICKYCVVTISSNFNWSSDISTITHKAGHSLSFIRRNVTTQKKPTKRGCI